LRAISSSHAVQATPRLHAATRPNAMVSRGKQGPPCPIAGFRYGPELYLLAGQPTRWHPTPTTSV
jgi:hypothetical protein